jgi:hypothetical protein
MQQGGVRRGHLVLHDFGGSWVLPGRRQRHQPGPFRTPGTAYPFRAVRGCILQHNRKKRPLCAGCHTFRPALEVVREFVLDGALGEGQFATLSGYCPPPSRRDD